MLALLPSQSRKWGNYCALRERSEMRAGRVNQQLSPVFAPNMGGGVRHGYQSSNL